MKQQVTEQVVPPKFPKRLNFLSKEVHANPSTSITRLGIEDSKRNACYFLKIESISLLSLSYSLSLSPCKQVLRNELQNIPSKT
mmetsp:Transcript_833/g.2090  ORF Transcript_833/g.2090 Transcript_833/m.2090 type:complete len:84 (-) Transcript_833:1083-1334(-)